MKLNQPQLTLAKTINMDAADDYWLHAVTFCGQTNYRADGFTVIDDNLDNGLLTIELYMVKDKELAELHFLTPMVHTLSLIHI